MADVAVRATGLRGALRAYVARRVPEPAVDDLVQDIYLRLLGSTTEPAELRGWVYAVARSAVADHHRRQVVAPPALAEAAAQDTGEEGVREAIAAWLRAQIPLLPAPYAETLALTELEGLSHADAATRLGVAKGTIKARVSRGRLVLRGRLDECCRVEVDARQRVVGWEPRSPCACGDAAGPTG